MFLFDNKDRRLLKGITEVAHYKPGRLRKLFCPELHPRGIREISEPPEVRAASAVMALLKSLSTEDAPVRLLALQTLCDEVLAGRNLSLRKNSARVVTQIMKELVRCPDNPIRQLELARDFRMSLQGKPRVVRKLLREYHLLEIPEDCQPATFDDHVHDASTKGRKSPSHLVLDAWIKGISELRVIYYNHVRPETVHELLEAARIMGITARIGIEFSAVFHDHYINLIWSPRGFSTPAELCRFLDEDKTAELLKLGREASQWQEKQIFGYIPLFNRQAIDSLQQRFGVTLPLLDADEFRECVGNGQASLVHLSEYILGKIRPVLQQKEHDLKSLGRSLEDTDVLGTHKLLREVHNLDAEAILWEYIKPLAKMFYGTEHLPMQQKDLPELLQMDTRTLVDRLSDISQSYSLTLSTAHIDAYDVPEIIWACQGKLSGLEIFNLKDHINNPHYDTQMINELRLYINRGDISNLKRICLELSQQMIQNNPAFCQERLQTLQEVSTRLAVIIDWYHERPIEALLGSDSAGRSQRLYGMGLATLDTLPARTQRDAIAQLSRGRYLLPVTAECCEKLTLYAPESPLQKIPLIGTLFRRMQRQWKITDKAAKASKKQPGNIITLGGTSNDANDELTRPLTGAGLYNHLCHQWRYLNGGLKKTIKILAGFIPAFLTFYYSKDWPLLMYGGAFIWFGITGVRNLIQAALGGGGLHRSHLLKWREFIDTARIADSLMYTGFSVPLLDLLIKTLLLQDAFKLTVDNNALAVYAVMAAANGLYIAGHNILRGLPTTAALGNLFRAVLSVPLSLAYNFIFAMILKSTGMANVDMALQLWAAVISKASSDTVACLIEGLADRGVNLNLRLREIKDVLDNYFKAYEDLEISTPGIPALELFENQKKLLKQMKPETAHRLVATGLDLLYMWYRKPRARLALLQILQQYSQTQAAEIHAGIKLLGVEKEVSKIFLSGFGGKDFSNPLAFYLAEHERFLSAMNNVFLPRIKHLKHQ